MSRYCFSIGGMGISNSSNTDFGMEGTVDHEKNPLRYARFWFSMSARYSGARVSGFSRMTKKVDDATQGPKLSLYTAAKLLVPFATKRISLGSSKCRSFTSCSRSGTNGPSLRSPSSSKCFACRYTTLPAASVRRKCQECMVAISPILCFNGNI